MISVFLKADRCLRLRVAVLRLGARHAVGDRDLVDGACRWLASSATIFMSSVSKLDLAVAGRRRRGFAFTP